MTHIFDRDNGRYLFIIWTIFLIFLCLVFIILFRDSDFRFYENPWNRSDARILGAFAILGIIGLIFILLVSGFLLTLYTIFNYLRRNDVKFRKKRDYYITLGIDKDNYNSEYLHRIYTGRGY